MQIPLIQNFKAHWPLKLAGVPSFVGLFFWGYFWLLKSPHYEVTEMRLTEIDRLIGYHPAAVLFYISLWLYISLAVGLLATLRELTVFGVGAAAMTVVGFGLFYFWPTAVPHLTFVGEPRSPMGLLSTIDAAGNACPSLHVSFVVFSGGWLEWKLREAAWNSLRVLNAAWGTAIIYSTMATRQHVASDVLAGAILGVLAVWGCHLALGLKRERRAV